MASRSRLDAWLAEQGYFESRQQAQRAIQAGQVYINGSQVDKPGTQVSGSLTVQIQARPAFVSRGGEKLVGALETFGVQVTGRIGLDSGISTGGFSDCLLQRGARQIYGIDVGYGQLAWALRTDPRVHLLERTNIRYLTPEQLYRDQLDWADLATLDLSFISLTKVLPTLWTLLRSPRECLLLVKPQFEAGREQVGKKGVVRDPFIHRAVLQALIEASQTLGWAYHGHTWSPIVGPAGNIEYWLWISDQPGMDPPTPAELLHTCQQAQTQLLTSHTFT